MERGSPRLEQQLHEIIRDPRCFSLSALLFSVCGFFICDHIQGPYSRTMFKVHIQGHKIAARAPAITTTRWHQEGRKGASLVVQWLRICLPMQGT